MYELVLSAQALIHRRSDLFCDKDADFNEAGEGTPEMCGRISKPIKTEADTSPKTSHQGFL
jgi:hypothetical protein